VNGTRARGVYLAGLALALWLGPALAPLRADETKPSLRLNEARERVTVEVKGLDDETLARLARLSPDAEQWTQVFPVFVDGAGKKRPDQPAMLGSYRVEKGTLRFEPRFPLVSGVRYRAVFDPARIPGGGKGKAAEGKAIEAVLSLPKPARTRLAAVTQVYPSADRLPENLLKFYLHFSTPMRQGDSYRHIQLLDAKGNPIDLPFLELDEELWDPSGTRFTLFFDPGRIKRGLKPREEVGPSLEEGKRYILLVHRTWLDAEGAPLKGNFHKTFTVTAPDDRPPDPKTWKLRTPTAGTREPLHVTFPKSMDHALLNRLLWVETEGDKKEKAEKVAGKIEGGERETLWVFTPTLPWRAGTYHLTADTRLEDLSGNSIGRPFEVDVLRPVEREVKKETVKVPFQVKK